MSLEDILYTFGCPDPQYRERPQTYLELWKYESGAIVRKKDQLPTEEFEDWLCQRKKHRCPEERNGKAAIAGLRILIHTWQKDDEDRGRFTIPFKKQALDAMTDTFCLPKTYPYEYTSSPYIPVRLESIATQAGEKIGIILQSVRRTPGLMTIVLSYDPRTNITCGFLDYIDKTTRSNPQEALLSQLERAWPQRNNPQQALLSQLERAWSQITHPLLLPSLAFNAWCEILHDDCTIASDKIKHIQKRSGLIRPYFGLVDGQFSQETVNYNDVHKDLVLQHTVLTAIYPDFVSALSTSMVAAFELLPKLCTSDGECKFQEYDDGLRAFVLHLKTRVDAELLSKNRLLSRIDMQLKALYHLTQQRDTRINYQIAVESKKDGSAMKSIALLTMIFLPSTAVATIFSMSPFFFTTPESEFNTSSHFWIYWAITIPLTITVLTVWLLWLNRSVLFEGWRKRRKNDVEKLEKEE